MLWYVPITWGVGAIIASYIVGYIVRDRRWEGEYVAAVLGWPVCLVIILLMVIGMGPAALGEMHGERVKKRRDLYKGIPGRWPLSWWMGVKIFFGVDR